MTNKASIYLTCAAISLGHILTPAPAMFCSVLLLMLRVGGAVGFGHMGAAPCVPWGVPGALSAAHSRLFPTCPVHKERRGLLFPFKTRPEEAARRLAALFVTLQPYKRALLERRTARLSGGV